jgi:hypothetical protein
MCRTNALQELFQESVRLGNLLDGAGLELELLRLCLSGQTFQPVQGCLEAQDAGTVLVMIKPLPKRRVLAYVLFAASTAAMLSLKTRRSF